MNKIEVIKRLRKETGMGLAAAKKAAEDANYEYDVAYKWLMENGGKEIQADLAFGKSGRIETYNHGGRIGVCLDMTCDTDFVANTDEFKTLCREVAMQIAATNPTSDVDLLEEEYIRDPKKRIKDIVGEVARKCAERVAIRRFARFEINK